jgi:hypothetical protein
MNTCAQYTHTHTHTHTHAHTYIHTNIRMHIRTYRSFLVSINVHSTPLVGVLQLKFVETSTKVVTLESNYSYHEIFNIAWIKRHPNIIPDINIFWTSTSHVLSS